MLSRTGKLYLAVLITNCMFGSVIAAENNNADELLSVDETSVDDAIANNPSDDIKTEDDTSDTVTSRQKSRSVKMIVGGQSTDGLAKEVILPVED